MKPKIKKIIAKEILIFSIGFLLLVGIFSSIWIINRIKQKNKTELMHAIVALELQKHKLRIQGGFDKYDELFDGITRKEIYDKLITDGYKVGTYSDFEKKISKSELRRILYDNLVKTNEIQKLGIESFEQFENELGIVTAGSLLKSKKIPPTFEEVMESKPKFDPTKPYVEISSIDTLELYDSKSNRLNTELWFLNKWINNYNQTISGIRIISPKELFHLSKQVISIILFILYPLRFFILAIFWALKILRSK